MKDLGMWYLPDGDDVCVDSHAMLKFYNEGRPAINWGGRNMINPQPNHIGSDSRGDEQRVMDRCCKHTRYWDKHGAFEGGVGVGAAPGQRDEAFPNTARKSSMGDER